MINRRTLLSLLGLACLTLQGPSAWAAEPLTLTVGDQFFSNRIVLELSGELKDLPYTIDFKRFNTGSPVASAVASGALDVGIVGDTPVISLAANGAPVKVVASTQTSLDGVGIVARKGIHSVADLKGKTVAIWNGSWSQQLAYKALDEAGVPRSSVHFKYLLPAEASLALTQGDIDAFGTWEPYVSLQEKEGSTLIRNAKGLMSAPTYIVAYEPALAQKSAIIKDFIARLTRARVWSNTHIDEYAEAWSKANQSTPEIAKVWFKRDAIKVLPISSTIVSEAQATADFLVDAQMLKQRYDVAPLFDRVL
ncbi:ABC transporter substrate-binding protein [Pseudomonas lurida]|uniref:ABC transporter substrate-binding protein n=1 Tax=Pseudomonas lurida TaxID=244566 RepID=UPI002734B4A0|nr:ABC transporter substrate-binding protein [Pseudomonas lurida]WLG26851.1 ABC transporter substrate-binding protein [Pseudomonas lurida]